MSHPSEKTITGKHQADPADASNETRQPDDPSSIPELSEELTPHNRRLIPGLFSSVTDAQIVTSTIPEYKD